jgi:acylphosphatase
MSHAGYDQLTRREKNNLQVEGEVQGPSEDVKKILKDINEGPRHSHVVKLSTENRDLIEDETEFKVRH